MVSNYCLIFSSVKFYDISPWFPPVGTGIIHLECFCLQPKSSLSVYVHQYLRSPDELVSAGVFPLPHGQFTLFAEL